MVSWFGHFIRFFAFWFCFLEEWDYPDAPTWPTMVNPEGNSSCSSSGSMAFIMSSGGSI